MIMDQLFLGIDSEQQQTGSRFCQQREPLVPQWRMHQYHLTVLEPSWWEWNTI